MAKKPAQVPHIGLHWIILALLVAIGGGLWIAQKGSSSKPVLPPPVTTGTKEAPKPAETTPSVAQTTPPVMPTPPAPEPAPAEVPQEEEQKLHHWLTESETPADAAEAMLADWKNLSEPGKIATSRHLANLVADDKFEPLKDLLLTTETSREVKEVLFADMLNRPNELKWPIIFQIMQQKTHPFSQDARNMLSVVLGADYGDDWAKWEERVKADLAKE